MARKKVTAPPMDAIETDFLDALRRLVDGIPREKALRLLLSRGRLKINISSVSQEARRSRTLIALADCRYPRVREMVRLAMEGRSAEPRTSAELIEKLRMDVAVLRNELKIAEAQTVAHFILRGKAEREAVRWRDIHERSLRKAPNKAATVVSLPNRGIYEA